LLFRLYISKARNVNAVGAVAEGHFVFVTGHFTAGACAHVMIHKVVAKLAAGIGKTVGKFQRGRIQKHARGLQRRSANEKHAGLEFESALRLRIIYANTGDAPRLRIEDEAENDAVGANHDATG